MRLLLIGTLLCLTTAMSAQILNDEINVLWRVTEAFANFDDEIGEEEYTLTFNTGITVTFDDYPLCLTMDGNGSATYVPTSITNSMNAGIPFTSDYYIGIRAWEDDGGSRCTLDDGDDAFFLGWSKISGGTVPGTGRSSRCLTGTGNLGADCVGDALIPPTNNYNFCYRVIWRHVNGNTINDPLTFGNIVALGQRNHFNSNRVPAEATGVPEASNYNNNYGEPSPDVYYVFSLDEDRENVVLSTDYDYTNFDTKIYLLDAAGELIAENDDISGADNRKSRIERSLCAGTYYVVVEGFDVNEGDFQLSVEASGFLLPVEATATVTGASCDGEMDGAVSVNAIDGVSPYTYRLFDANMESLGSFNQSIDNLSANTTYFYQVVDACGGTTSAESFTVGVFDNEDPVAVCVGGTIMLPDGTVDSPFSESEISQLGGRSTDNCGIDEVTMFPNTISATIGDTIFVYELTVFDAMGNSAAELCSLTVVVTPNSVEQLPALDAALTAYPNPTAGLLTVTIEDFAIATGELTVRDLSGRTILRRAVNNTPPSWTEQLDLSSYPAGIYTLQVTTPEGQLTRRIVRQ
ncbi:MAG: DVUA0089 family protein [Bacteroidota bacterium]